MPLGLVSFCFLRTPSLDDESLRSLPERSGFLSFIYFFSVCYFHNYNGDHFIVDLVKHSVDSLSYPVFFFSGKLLGLRRSRVFGQGPDLLDDPIPVLLLDFF